MSQVIKLCQELVRRPSVNSEVDETMNFLQQSLTAHGFSVRLLAFENERGQKVTNLCASYGSGSPHLLFVGHADVVAAGSEDMWRYPPFAATIDNNVLYGRGVADMKGGIACFAQACYNYISQNPKFNGKITYIISGDEEEPIVRGTQKVLEQLHREGEIFDFALVGEPSNPLCMGDEIKIGRRGDMVVHLHSYGKQGHTAYANSRDNPIYYLINLLQQLQQDKPDNGNAYFQPSVVQVTTIDVGNPASNVVPQAAHAVVDIRFNSEHTLQQIETWVQHKIQHVGGHIEAQFEPIGEAFLSPINQHITLLQQIISRHTGKTPAFSTAGGTSDARFVRQYCPVAEYGLTNATIHQINECEKTENIEILCDIYQEFLEKFFGANSFDQHL